MALDLDPAKAKMQGSHSSFDVYSIGNKIANVTRYCVCLLSLSSTRTVPFPLFFFSLFFFFDSCPLHFSFLSPFWFLASSVFFLLQVGDRLLVKPGALVPADGTVVSGDSTVDESMVSCLRLWRSHNSLPPVW